MEPMRWEMISKHSSKQTFHILIICNHYLFQYDFVVEKIYIGNFNKMLYFNFNLVVTN